MANYENIMRLRPAFREFVLHRRLMHRGDVLCFPPNYRSGTFSTDARGFRHTLLASETLSVADIVQRKRFGLVLGGSKVFGLGLAGNENTMPSLLSKQFGFPFATVAFPQGNSRNLASSLQAIVAQSPKSLAAVVHVSGGDLTGFAYSSMADPVFGSPNPKQIRLVREEQGGLPPARKSLEALLAFSSLWTRAITLLCRSNDIPLVLVNDTTFFEKRKPSTRDIDCDLGTPYHVAEERWFANQREFAAPFYERREALTGELGVPLVAPSASNDLGFIDEFHFDEDGTRVLSDATAKTLEPLL